MTDLFAQPEESKPAEEPPTDYTGLIIFLALLPMLIVLDHFGKLEMGLNICICIFVNLVAVRFRWRLRRHGWFWATIAILTAIELPLMINIRWPHRWVPGSTLLPIAIAGYMVAIGAVRLAEMLFLKTASSDEGQ